MKRTHETNDDADNNYNKIIRFINSRQQYNNFIKIIEEKNQNVDNLKDFVSSLDIDTLQDYINKEDNLALKIASISEKVDIVEYLLENGADATAGNFFALQQTLNKQNKQIYDMLMKKIEPPNARSITGRKLMRQQPQLNLLAAPTNSDTFSSLDLDSHVSKNIRNKNLYKPFVNPPHMVRLSIDGSRGNVQVCEQMNDQNIPIDSISFDDIDKNRFVRVVTIANKNIPTYHCYDVYTLWLYIIQSATRNEPAKDPMFQGIFNTQSLYLIQDKVRSLGVNNFWEWARQNEYAKTLLQNFKIDDIFFKPM